MALANVTEGPARATLKGHRAVGSWHGKHWLTDMRPNRRMIRQSRNNPYLRDAQEMQRCKGIERKAHSMVTENGRV